MVEKTLQGREPLQSVYESPVAVLSVGVPRTQERGAKDGVVLEGVSDFGANTVAARAGKLAQEQDVRAEVGNGDEKGHAQGEPEKAKGKSGEQGNDGGAGEPGAEGLRDVGFVEDFAEGQLAAGDILAVDAWPQIVQALVDRAKQGNIDAARELRQAIVEPIRSKISRQKQPVLPPVVLEALRWLPKALELNAQPVQPTDNKGSE